MKATGERVTIAAGGYNPTFQRHVAAYALLGDLVPGRVVDLGCGVGHSWPRLGARWSVGLDLEPKALVGQRRATAAADMRRIPLRDRAVDGVFSSQSVEHVPDPHVVVAETARVLAADGTAVFVTPNRLTFARADEIIDPWHFVEFDADQLRSLCSRSFAEVELLGVFGSSAYLAFQGRELAKLDRLLRLDPLRLRRWAPRRLLQVGYSTLLRHSRKRVDPAAGSVTDADFHLGGDDLPASLDLVAVCRRPR